MKLLSDTSPEAQRVLDAVFRAMPVERKLGMLGQANRLARELHEGGVRLRNPQSTRAEIQESWNSMMLGKDLWNSIKRDLPMNQDLESIEVLRAVLGAFERLAITYAVGGSWASTVHGVPRMTRDADVMVTPFPGKERLLADGFGSDYYVSVPAIEQANRERSSFNIIHIPTAFKVDVFIQKPDHYELTVMERRAPATRSGSGESPWMMVSAEDIILLKLRWFRLGNEVSDRQWLDVLGVLRTQSGELDEAYLDHWAKELRIDDLLTRARADLEP